MDRERRHARVEVSIRKRQSLRRGIDRRAEMRWARMVADGSTAVIVRFNGSYDPAPAPTFKTDRDVPRAARMTDAMRGSGCRKPAYPAPITP
jgi:hypothetical protein